MIKNIVLVALLSLSSVSVGHAETTVLAQKTKLKVVSVVAQQGLDAQIVPSTGGANAGAQYGLIGALVGGVIDANADKKRALEADSAVAKYRDMLVGFDFHAPYDLAVRDALGKSSLYEVSEYASSVNAQDVNQKPNTKLTPISEQQLLVLDTRYSLSPDFNTLYLMVTGAVYEPSPDKTAPYVKRKFEMIYQGESRLEGFALSTPELKAAELASIETRYAKLIEEDPTKQSSLLSKKKSELAKAQKTRFVRLDPQMVRDGWSNVTLSAEINKGIAAIAAAITGELERKLTDKSRAALKKQAEKIPYRWAAGIFALNPSEEKAVAMPNDENAKNGLSQYYFPSLWNGQSVRKDVLYIVPSGDVVSAPM